MICDGCNTTTAYKIQLRVTDKGQRVFECNECANLSPTVNPDVYWPGHSHYNENITDNMGRPILLTSKGHKARVLKEKNMSEAGDRVHGSFIGASGYATKKK